MFSEHLQGISPQAHVLVAGPTASGKSALGLAIAEAQGGTIVNADASQIFDCWRVITARPSAQEEQRAPHRLFGHVTWDQEYSAGHWARDVGALLQKSDRLIIVGGTGLYFQALVEGLSEIPQTPSDVRALADQMTLADLCADLDDTGRQRIDVSNRARVQRAWEVQHATGRPLWQWQDTQPKPILPGPDVVRLVMDAPKEWLGPRIAARFDQMLDLGAAEEVSAMAQHFDPSRPAFRAIGVPQLHAYNQGDMSLPACREAVTIATRQYAKRQRTWLRKRCNTWKWISPKNA